MARKHAKKFSKKQPVNMTVIAPEKRTSERKVVLNPTSGEYEVVYHETVTPAVVKQGIACGSTSTKGKRNVTDAKPKAGVKK